MEVFSKIGKIFLYMILGFTIFMFIMDLGKGHMANLTNTYIASSSSNYVSKFVIEEEDLLVFDKTLMTADDVKKSLSEYFDLQYTNLNYVRADDKDRVGGSLGNYQFKAIYYPEGWADDTHQWLGPIIVRAKLYGFPGLGDNVSEEDKGKIVVNIEQKVPAGMRNFMIANGIELDAGEGRADGKDFDGYWGYYDIISQYAFKVNVIDNERGN